MFGLAKQSEVDELRQKIDSLERILDLLVIKLNEQD
jgi:polyhydroxyalkanoate synthesis regulator phasin